MAASSSNLSPSFLERRMRGEIILIFDLDGTLLDTLEDLWASVNHVLAQFSLPLRSMSEVRNFLGNGARVLVRSSLPVDATEGLEERVYEAFRSHYLLHSYDHTRPYSGILDMLKVCKARGYHTAIVSNKPDAAVQQLHRRFFDGVIDVAVGEQQPRLRRKPAPDMVFEAIHLLSEQEDCASPRKKNFYIGDSEVDIVTAKSAGLPCISVDWGFRDRHFLKEKGADCIIHQPKELLQIIC